MNRHRTFNICLTVVITAAFILLGAFVFGDSYLRFGETVKDFGLSVGYYFCTLFGLDHDIVPSVTEYSSVMDWDILLPSDFEGFTSQAKSFFSLLVDEENFSGYWAKVGDVMLVLLKVVAIILPCLLILGLVIWRLYKSGNTKHNRDTVPLKVFKSFSRCLYLPLKRIVLSYRDFLTEHRAVWIIWVVIWVFNLNAASIVMGFLAYYFYFVLSFDVANLYVRVQAVHRLAGHLPALSVVVYRVRLLAAVRPLAEEHRFEQTAALRGEELRLYKRAADSQYGVRKHGQEKDDAHHGHGTLARGDVQAEGIGDLTAERHEIPILPVDRFRGRTAAVYGAWYGVQSCFGQGLGGVEAVKVHSAQKRANATLRIRL